MIAATHWLGVYEGKVDFMFSRGFLTACSLAPSSIVHVRK
jgi:hypothetical protein